MCDDDELAESATPWKEWPVCPRCATPRQCICPVCETAGIEFPLADYQVKPAPLIPVTPEKASAAPEETRDDSLPLLRCMTCDEVFSPRFYDECHACGFVFAQRNIDGGPENEGIPERILMATFVILAIVVSILAYFWLLLRR